MKKYSFIDKKNGGELTINVSLDENSKRATGNIKIKSGSETLINGFTGEILSDNSFVASGKNGNFIMSVKGMPVGDYLNLDVDFVFPNGAKSEKTYIMPLASSSNVPSTIGQTQLPETPVKDDKKNNSQIEEIKEEEEEEEESYIDSVKNKTGEVVGWIKENMGKLALGALGIGVGTAGVIIGGKKLKKRRKNH